MREDNDKEPLAEKVLSMCSKYRILLDHEIFYDRPCILVFNREEIDTYS
jgi:hypothetical protein